MSRRDRGRILAATGLIAIAVAAASVPATSGAFLATVTNTVNTAGAAARFTCKAAFASAAPKNNAYFEYELTGNAATASDSSTSGNTGNFQASGAHPTGTAVSSSACPNDTTSPYFYAPDGSSNWIQTSNSVGTTPATFSLLIWFQTTKAGGYLIGLNSSQTATTNSGVSYDRHLYVDTGGKVTFGSYNGAIQALRSTSALNDGAWHQAVGTMSTSTGMALWIDGVKVASDATFTSSQANTGYWRIGFGPLDSWPNAPTSTYFQGGLRYAAAYKYVLSDSEIAAMYADGKPGP